MLFKHVWFFNGQAPDIAAVARELGQRVGSRVEIEQNTILLAVCGSWIHDCKSFPHAFECFTLMDPYVMVQLGQLIRALGGTRTPRQMDENPPDELNHPWADLSWWTKKRLGCYFLWPRRWWTVPRTVTGPEQRKEQTIFDDGERLYSLVEQDDGQFRLDVIITGIWTTLSVLLTPDEREAYTRDGETVLDNLAECIANDIGGIRARAIQVPESLSAASSAGLKRGR